MKIPALLTGIVTLTGLYSINIKIMGSVPNLSLGDSSTVFKQLASLGLTNEEAVFSLSFSLFLTCLFGLDPFDENRDLAWSCVRLGIIFR